MALETVCIELDCHPDEKVKEMATDCEKKVEAMAGVLRSFKKLVFQAEAELKKDCNKIMEVRFYLLVRVGSA